MVSELERLNTVINTLEEQSNKAVQFNGVIHKLETLKDEITSSSEEIKKLHSAHKELASDVAEKIEENGNKTFALQTKLATYQREQASAELVKEHFDKVNQNILNIESKISALEHVIEEQGVKQIEKLSFKLEEQFITSTTYLKFISSALTLISIGLLLNLLV
jgi:ABC-type transporter Mla subunit MlaD